MTDDARPARAAVILAPFWGDPAHVGSYRIDRFIRWLRSADVDVAVVRAGPRPAREQRDWGLELTVADPLHAVSLPQHRVAQTPARLLQLRRVLVSLVSPPDGRLRWARLVAADPGVQELARRATWIISSSPPESSHLAAAALARTSGARFVMDMRDGWLDEPLKWLLQHSRLQRWREGRMERDALHAADRVFVVSDVLGEMLAERVPATARKTTVLTNCGPPAALAPAAIAAAPYAAPGRLQLLYAGRFTGSNRRQRAHLLFDVIGRAAAARPSIAADVRLLGAYEHDDIAAIDAARTSLAARAWTVERAAPAPRDEALRAMAEADGLLLLAMGHGVLTTKLFEYLATGRPILAVTVAGGAIWRLGARLPQLFVVATDGASRDESAATAFLDACAAGRRFEPPAEFAEPALRERFLAHIGAAPSAGSAV